MPSNIPRTKRRSPTKVDFGPAEEVVHQKAAQGKKVTHQPRAVDARASNSDGIVGARGAKGWNASKEAGDQVQVRTSASENQVSVRGGMHQRPRKHRARKANEEETKDKGKLHNHSVRTSVTTVGGGDGRSMNASTHRGDGEMVSNTTISIIGKSQRKDMGGVEEAVRKQEGETLPDTKPQAEQGEEGKEAAATKTGKLISLAKNIWTFLTPQPPKRKSRPPRPKYKPKSQPWHTARIFELKMREKAVDSQKKDGGSAVGKRKIVKKEYIEMDQYVSKKGVKKDKVVEVLHARVTRKTSKGVIQGETVDQEIIVEKVMPRKKSPTRKDMKRGDAELEVEKRRHRQIGEKASRSRIGAHYDDGDTEANQGVEKSRSPKQVAGEKRSQWKKPGVVEEKVENTKVRRTTSDLSNESNKHGQCENVDCAARLVQERQSPTQENLCGKIKRVLLKSRHNADDKSRPIICLKECPGATRALEANDLSRSKARRSSKHSIKSTLSPEHGIKETETRDGKKRHRSKTRGDSEQRRKSNTSLATETKEKELKVRKKRPKSPGRDTSEQVKSKRKKTKQRDASKPNVKSTPPPDDNASELEEVAKETRSKSKPRHASKPKAKSASSSVKENREPKGAGECKREKSKPRDALKSILETTPSVDEDTIRETVKCARGTCRKSKTRDASKPKVKSTLSPSVADKGESKEKDEGAHRKSDKFIEVECKKLKSPDSSKSKIKSTSRVVEKEHKHNKSEKLHKSTSPPVEKVKVKCVEGTCKKLKSRDSSRSLFKSNLPSANEMEEMSTDEEVGMPSERPNKPSRVHSKKHKGEVDKTVSKSSCNMQTSNIKTGHKNSSSLLAPNDRKSPHKLAKETRSKSKKQSALSLTSAEDVKESAEYVECKNKKLKSRDSSKPKPKLISPSVEEVRESTKCDEVKCRKSKSRDDSSKKTLNSSKSPTKGMKVPTQNKESKSKTRNTSEHSVKSTPSPVKGTKHEDKTVVIRDSKSSNRKKPSKPAEKTISVEVITTISKKGDKVYKTRSKSSDNQLGRKADEKPSIVSTRRLKREQSKNEMLGSSTEEETELPSERPRKPPRLQGKERKEEEDKTVSKNSTSVLPPNDKTGRKSSSNVLAPSDKKSPHKLDEVTENIPMKSKRSVKKIKSENIRTMQTCGQVNDSEKDNFASKNASPSSDEIAECECHESKLSEQILRDIREEAKRLGVMTSSAYKFLSNLNERISVLKKNVKRSKSVHGDSKRISPKSSVTKKRSKSADVTSLKHDTAETCPKFEESTSFRNLEVNDIECDCEDERELITENEKSTSGKSKVKKSSDSKPSVMAEERVERKKSQIKGSSRNKASVMEQTDQNNAFAALGEELLTTLRNDPRLLQNLDALVEAIRSGTPYQGLPSNEVKTPKASLRPKAIPKMKSNQKHNLKAEMKSNLEKLEEEPDETSESNKETKLKPEEHPKVSRERAGASPEDSMPSGENFQNQVECDIFSMELSSFQKKFGRYLDDSCLEKWKESKMKSAEGPRPVTKTKSERDGGPPSSQNRNPRFAKSTAPVSSHKISLGKQLAIPIPHDSFKQHGQSKTLEATETHGDASEQTGDWVIKLSQPVTFNEIRKVPIKMSEGKRKENVNPVRGLRNFETDVRSCFGTSRRENTSFREPVEERLEGEEISNRRRSSSQVKEKDVVEKGHNYYSGIALTEVVHADIHMKAVDICKRIMKDKPLKGMAFDKLYENIVCKLLEASDLAIPQEHGINTETFNSASTRSTSQDQSYGGKSIRRYRLNHHKWYCNAMPKVRRQPESKNKKKSKGKFRPKNHQLSQDEVSSLLSSELNNTKTSVHRTASSNHQIQNEDCLLAQGIEVEAQRQDRNCQQANTDNDTNFSTFNRNEKGKYLLKESERKYQVLRGEMDKTKYKSMIRNDDNAKCKDISYYDNGTPTYSEFSGNPLEEDREEDLDRLVSASELRKRETPSNESLEFKVEPTSHFNLARKDVPFSTHICTPRNFEKETILKDSKRSLQLFTKSKDVLKKISSKEMRATQGKIRDTECQTNAKERNSTQLQRRISTSKERSNLSENFKRRVPAQDLLTCMRTRVPSISKPFQANSIVKTQEASCTQIFPLAKYKGSKHFVQNNNNEELITDETKGPDVWPNNIDKRKNTGNETKFTPKDKKTPLDCNVNIKNNTFVSNLKSVNPRKIANYLALDRKLQQEKKETNTRPTTACTSKTNESQSKNQSKSPAIGRRVNKSVPHNKFLLLKNETINKEDNTTLTNAPTSKNDNKSSKFPNKMITRNKTVGTDTQKQPSVLFRSKTFTCDKITDRESLRVGVNKQQASPKAGTQNSNAPSTGNRAKSAGFYSFRTSVKVSPEPKSAPSHYMSQQKSFGDKIRAKSSQYTPAVSKSTQVKNSNGKTELGRNTSTNKGQVYKSLWGSSLRKRSKTNVKKTEAVKTSHTQKPNNKQNNKSQIETLPSSTRRKILTPKIVPFFENIKKTTTREDVYKSDLALKPTTVATDPMLVKPSKVKHIYTVKLNGNPSPTDCRLENGTSIASTNQERKTQLPTVVEKSTKCRVNRTGAEKTPQRGKLQNEQCRSKKLALNGELTSRKKTKQQVQQDNLANSNNNQVFQKKVVERSRSMYTIKNNSQDQPDKEANANSHGYLRTNSHSGRNINQRESSTFREDTTMRTSSREIQHDTSLLRAKDDCLDYESGQNSRSLELPRSQMLVPNPQSLESGTPRATESRPSKPNPATRRLPRVPSNIIRSVSRSLNSVGSKNFSKTNAKWKPVDLKVFASPVKIVPSHTHKVVDARELTSKISSLVHVESKASRESKNITEQNSNSQNLDDKMAFTAKNEHKIEIVNCSKVNQEEQSNSPLKSQTEWMKTAEEKQLWWEKHVNKFEDTVLKAPDELTDAISSINRAPKNFVKRNIIASSQAATIAERNRESARKSGQRWYNRITTQHPNGKPSPIKQVDEENVSSQINVMIAKHEGMENGQEMIDVDEDVGNNRQMLSTNGTRNEILRESSELNSSSSNGSNIKEEDCLETRDNKWMTRIDRDDQTRQEVPWGMYAQNNYAGTNDKEIGLKSTGAIPKYRGYGNTNHSNFTHHVDTESESAVCTDMINNPCDLQYEALQESEQTMNVTMIMTPRVYHEYQPNSNHAGLKDSRSKYMTCNDSNENIFNCESCEEIVKHREKQMSRGDDKFNYGTSEGMVKRREQQTGLQDNKANYETREEIVQHHEQLPDHRDKNSNYKNSEDMFNHREQQMGHRDHKSNYETSEEMIKRRERQMGDRDNKNKYETCEEMVKHHVQMPGHRDNNAKYETNKEMIKHHEHQTDRRDHKSNYETSKDRVERREKQTGHRNNKSNYETREDMVKIREQPTGRRDKSYTCIQEEESDSFIVDSSTLVKKFSANLKMVQKEYSCEEESEGSGSSSSSTAENIDSGILGTSQRNSPFKESSSTTVDTSNTSRETAHAEVVCRTDTSASTTGSDSSCVSTDENCTATQDDSDSVSKSSGSLEQCSFSSHKMREGELPKPKERQTNKSSHFPWNDFHGDYVEIPVLNDIQTVKGKKNKNGSVNLITPSSENLLAQAVGSRKFSREQETLKQFYKTVQIPHGPRPSLLNVEDLDQYQNPKPDKGSRVIMGNSQAKVTHNREPVIRMPTILSENNGRAMKRDLDGRAVHNTTTPRGLMASKPELLNKPYSRQISPAKPPRSPSPPPRNPPSPAPNKRHGSQDNKSSSMRAESLGRNNGRVSSRTRQCDGESITRKSNHYERDSVAVKSNINDNGGFSARTDVMSTTHKGPKMLQVTNCTMEKNNARNMIQITNDRECIVDKFTLSEDEAYLGCFYDESMFMNTGAKNQEEYYQGLETGGGKYSSGNLKKPSNAKNKGEQLDKGSSRPKADNVDADCLLEKSKDAIKKIVSELDRKNTVKKQFASFVPSTPEKLTSNREGKQPCHEKRNSHANACLHEMANPEGTSQRTGRSSMGTSAKNYIEIIKAPHGTSDSECSHCTSSTSFVCNSDKHTRITSKLAQTKLTTQNCHIETVHHKNFPQTPKREDVRLIKHEDCERLKNFGKTDKRTLETVSKKSETHNQVTNSPDNDKQFTVGYKKEMHVEKHPLGTMTSNTSKKLDTVYKNNSCETGVPSEEVLEVSCDQNSKLFQILTRTVDGNGEVKNYLMVDNCLKELVIVDNKIKLSTIPSAEVEMESISALKTLDGPPTQESELAKRSEVSSDTQKSALNLVPVNENTKENKRKGTETSTRNSFNEVQQSNITEPCDAEEQVKKGKTRIVANVTIAKRNVGPFEAELQRESNDIKDERRVDGSDEETSEDESSSSSGDSDAIQRRTESRSSDDSEQSLDTRRKSDLDVPWSLATNVKSPVRSRTVNVISNPDETREWDSNESTSRTSLESTSVSSSSNDDTSSEAIMESPPTTSLTTSKNEQHSHLSSTISEEASDLHIKPEQSRHAQVRKNSKDDQSNTSEEKVSPAIKESISSKERMPVESTSEEDLVQLTSSTIELMDSATVCQPPPRSTRENISAVEIRRKTSASRGTMTEETSKSNTRIDYDNIRKYSTNTLSRSDDDRKYSLDTLKNSDDVRIKADNAWRKRDDARKQSFHDRISSHEARKHPDDSLTISTDETIKTPRMMSHPVSREILRSAVSLQTDRSEPRENIPANNRIEKQTMKKQYTDPNEKILISKKSEKKFAEHIDDHKDKVTSKTEKTSERERKKSKDNKSTTKTRSSERSFIGRETGYQSPRQSSILKMIYETDKQKFEDVRSYTESIFLNNVDTSIETDSQEYDIQINKKYVTDSSKTNRKTKRDSRGRIEEEDLKKGHYKGQAKKKDNANVKNDHSKKGDSGKHKIFTQVGRWIGKKIDKI